MKAPHPSPEELVTIKANIQKQAELVRKLKDSTTDQGTLALRADVLKQVAHLLELKVLDPDVFINEPKLFEKKQLKIRWIVEFSRNENTQTKADQIRVQFRFPDRTSVSGEEVWQAIQQETTRKYPSLQNIVSVQKSEPENKKQFVDISKEEMFFLPLVFPGPLFKADHAFEFKVTWSGAPPPPPKQRKVYSNSDN